MSELIQMRQRMKAIETIKKVTHAMRLIAMSLHARLRSKRLFVDEYAQGIAAVFAKIRGSDKAWTHGILWPSSQTTHELVIVIGSQKGLCGNFNTNLAAFFAHHTVLKQPADLHLIVIGKRMVDILNNFAGTNVMEFRAFNQNNLISIAQKITDYILHIKHPYSSVTLYYNFPKTFFAQRPQAIQLIPFTSPAGIQTSPEPYHWEHDPGVILETLAYNLLFSTINQALVQSLIAEQAARFIAMDSSTRNASNLLDEMKMNYNKLRQTKITRELTDLVSGL